MNQFQDSEPKIKLFFQWLNKPAWKLEPLATFDKVQHGVHVCLCVLVLKWVRKALNCDGLPVIRGCTNQSWLAQIRNNGGLIGWWQCLKKHFSFVHRLCSRACWGTEKGQIRSLWGEKKRNSVTVTGTKEAHFQNWGRMWEISYICLRYEDLTCNRLRKLE